MGLTLSTAAIALAVGAALAQDGFEVASVHRNAGGGTNTGIQVSGGRLRVTNGSVKTLIRNAYGILAFQLAGEPRWLDTEMYDIVATTGVPEALSEAQFRSLLQSILKDRFQLSVHWETRESPVFALTADKAGAKLHEGGQGGTPGINTRKEPGRVHMVGTSEPLAILASNLGNQLGRIVLDRTGLSGSYDWVLDWDPDPTAESTRPSLTSALREQLGLRLEAQKGPMEVLVIDRVEHPSEN